jgi:hypothetical protein
MRSNTDSVASDTNTQLPRALSLVVNREDYTMGLLDGEMWWQIWMASSQQETLHNKLAQRMTRSRNKMIHLIEIESINY